jgi:hypothetical protein
VKVRLVETSLGTVQVADWGGEIHVAQFDSEGVALKEGSSPGSVTEALFYVLGLAEDEAVAVQRQLENEGWEPSAGIEAGADAKSGWWVVLAVVVVPCLALVGIGFLIWLVVDQVG